MFRVQKNLNACGPNVKRLRNSHMPPLTQEMLAMRLQMIGWDIDRFVVSKIERQTRQVTDIEILLLAQALDADISELLETRH